jgi:hypothetical protein
VPAPPLWGGDDPEYSADDYYRRLIAFAQANGIAYTVDPRFGCSTVEEQINVCAFNHTKDPARSFFASKLVDEQGRPDPLEGRLPYRSKAELLEALRSFYSLLDPAWLARSELYKIKLALPPTSQRVQTHIAAFRRHLAHCQDMAEADRVLFWTMSLGADLTKRVMDTMVNRGTSKPTLDLVHEITKQLVLSDEQAHAARVSSSGGGRRGIPLAAATVESSQPDLIEALQVQLAALRAEVRRGNGGSPQAATPANRNKFYDFRRYGLSSQEEYDRRLKGGLCLCCGKDDHRLKQCPDWERHRQQQPPRRSR